MVRAESLARGSWSAGMTVKTFAASPVCLVIEERDVFFNFVYIKCAKLNVKICVNLDVKKSVRYLVRIWDRVTKNVVIRVLAPEESSNWKCVKNLVDNY